MRGVEEAADEQAAVLPGSAVGLPAGLDPFRTFVINA